MFCFYGFTVIMLVIVAVFMLVFIYTVFPVLPGYDCCDTAEPVCNHFHFNAEHYGCNTYFKLIRRR